jgi:hypothetical protein
MIIAKSTRGTRGDRGARLGRQAPLSGRQGAFPANVTGIHKSRPVDTIAEARGLAEVKA